MKKISIKIFRIIITTGAISTLALMLGGCQNPSSYFDYVYDPMQSQILEQSQTNTVNYSNQPVSFIPMSTQAEIKPIAGTTLDLDRQLSVRNPSTIKALTIGRYIDPNSGTMHERHIVYQVENSSSWNTRPNPEIELPYGSVVRPPNWANESPLYAELESELIKAKDSQEIFDEAKDALQSNIKTIKESKDSLNLALYENQRLKAELFHAQKQINKLSLSVNANSNAINMQNVKFDSMNRPSSVYENGLVDKPAEVDNKGNAQKNTQNNPVDTTVKPAVNNQSSSQKPEVKKFAAGSTATSDEYDSFEV